MEKFLYYHKLLSNKQTYQNNHENNYNFLQYSAKKNQEKLFP